MRSLKTPPRLRAALVVALGALATMAVAVPASAAESGLAEVKMFATCSHPEPVVFTKIKCSGRVRNPLPIGGAPTGELQLRSENTFDGAFPTGSNRCMLQPDPGNPNVSSCSVVYEPRRLDLQLLEMAYLGDATFDPAVVEDIPLIVFFGAPTHVELTCQKVNFGAAGKCIVLVQLSEFEADELSPPGGTVTFSSVPIGAPVAFSPPSCRLEPLTSAASFCAVDYWPIKPGSFVFLAAYEGSSITRHHRSSKETTVTVKPPVNAPL